MGTLREEKRAAATREFMEDVSRENDECGGYVEGDIRAAIDALDTWLNANAAVINAVLPLPFRTEATTSQKARLLALVIRYRYIEGV